MPHVITQHSRHEPIATKKEDTPWGSPQPAGVQNWRDKCRASRKREGLLNLEKLFDVNTQTCWVNIRQNVKNN